ncbi:alpha/beta fold hydrolase [Rhodococcus sp. HNM0569]|uniref:alpha/beta fold hydrolase n=1 Tax=Rhodococcus sp. HNM0569 TaxID=2716340 RepID=UPI00146EDF89|nr:alpha/beta fold hydrolase [Rhodococcus sp. HNM0569]NLU83725.1 alpha/beta fold hydrolase [Rhodococcus sp. HNM0569]
MRAINPLDGVEIDYDVVGSGDPLVLLHGSALSRGVWRAFGYVRALRETYRLILVDQRGHGRSDKPHDEERYAMDVVAADVVAVLDAANVERAHVCGYSFGGRTALTTAVAHPERVRSLALGGASSRPQRGSFDALFFDGAAAALARDGMDEFLRRWELVRDAPIDSGTRAAFRANDSRALAAYMSRSDVEPGIPDDALAAIDVPTLVFVGDRDRQRLADCEHLATTIPDAVLSIVPGADHATTLAHSAEVLGVLAPFLNRT